MWSNLLLIMKLCLRGLSSLASKYRKCSWQTQPNQLSANKVWKYQKNTNEHFAHAAKV